MTTLFMKLLKSPKIVSISWRIIYPLSPFFFLQFPNFRYEIVSFEKLGTVEIFMNKVDIRVLPPKYYQISISI